MTDEARLDLEREWLAAAAERDDLRAAVGAARQSGDAKALATARLRLKEATNRGNEIMARYQQAVGVSPLPSLPSKLPKPARPLDARKADAARVIVEELADLIDKADAAGLTVVAGIMIAARDAARRVIEPRGGEGRKVE